MHLPFREALHFGPEGFAVGIRFLPERIHRRLPGAAVGGGFGTVGGGLSLESRNLGSECR